MRWHTRLLLVGVTGLMALASSACASGQVRGAAIPHSGGSAPGTTPVSVYAPNADVVTGRDPAPSCSTA